MLVRSDWAVMSPWRSLVVLKVLSQEQDWICVLIAEARFDCANDQEIVDIEKEDLNESTDRVELALTELRFGAPHCAAVRRQTTSSAILLWRNS